MDTYNIDLEEEGSVYSVVCCNLLAADKPGVIVLEGAVEMSGYWDGVYKVFVKNNVESEMIAVKVVFCGEEEKE